MIPPDKRPFATVLHWWQILRITSQVAQTVAEQQQSRVLEQLLARESLIEILQADDKQPFAVDVHRGFAGKLWRVELLGIMDLIINDWLVGLYPITSATDRIWLSPAQLQAQSAPDWWAVLTLARYDDG